MARRSAAPRRYAEAAFEIALRDGTVEDWRRQLEMAADAMSDPAVAEAIHNPAIPTADREAALAKGLEGQVQETVLNLLRFMVRRGRIEDLPRVVAEFQRLDDQRNGVVNAIATSAAPLQSSEIEALRERFEQMTGGKLKLSVDVDPSLLGGLVVRVGDQLIDGSVRSRLDRLRTRLASGAF